MGETVFYSVRVDKSETASSRGWFLIEEIEQDPYPARPLHPLMRWDANKLEIESIASSLSGLIEFHEGDFTLVRSHVRSLNPE